ncbi:MAG TPA: histidine phosphatase family protein [bacterium]|nr:histidine phosphatase family protein [bacterium]
MSYQVLARKWRPRSFASLVGQEHVVRALTHALTAGRLHHAYLFTGTRGVGKTTLARILAKALAPLEIRHALASPLGRAQQTAAIIREEAGIPMEATPALREVSFGAFEGHTLDELEIHFPGMWAARMADKWNYRPPQGESNAEAVPRAREVVKRIESWGNGGPLLIIAHFAINRIILSLLADIPPRETIEMNVPHTVIYRAQKLDGAWRISYRDAEDPLGGFLPGWIRQEDPAKPMGG